MSKLEQKIKAEEKKLMAILKQMDALTKRESKSRYKLNTLEIRLFRQEKHRA
jgi:hypothetical protein